MLFRDRLEIINPGALPLGWSIEKLKRPHASVPFNPLLAEPMYLKGYIERLGTGTADMMRLAQLNNLREPIFEQNEDFTITIYRPSTNQVPTKYRPSTDQVDPVIIEKIVEVPVYVEKGGLPIDEYFGKEDLIELQKIEIDEVVEPQIEQESNVQEEPKRLSYSNRNGKSLRFNRF
jgi:hypothetical protein